MELLTVFFCFYFHQFPESAHGYGQTLVGLSISMSLMYSVTAKGCFGMNFTSSFSTGGFDFLTTVDCFVFELGHESTLPKQSKGKLQNANTYEILLLHFFLLLSRASLVAQRLKCLPARRETRVQSLGWEDLLEKEMATHSNILAWRAIHALNFHWSTDGRR